VLEKSALSLYSLAWRLARPWVHRYLQKRAVDDPAYLLFHEERFAQAFAPGRDFERPLIWLHLVSLGETRAASALVQTLRERLPNSQLLLTHMTPSGREAGEALIQQWGGKHVLQCYWPYDLVRFQERFFNAFKPSVGVMLETEVWPNMLAVAQEKKLPMLLASARLSEKSLDKGRRAGLLIKQSLRRFAQVQAQTQEDANRIRLLGRDQVDVIGNLKFDVEPNAQLVQQGRQWLQQIRASGDQRPIVMLAASREGEDKLILDAWRKTDPGDVMLLMVPRHQERFSEAFTLAKERGYKTIRRSEVTNPSELAGMHVVIGDSFGEMPLYYALAQVAIMGGTLQGFGGQNLIEALACDCPVVIGPSLYNFAQAASEALRVNAAVAVDDATQAVATARELAQQPAQLAIMGLAGQALIQANRGATEKVFQAIVGLMPSDLLPSSPH
jgi:3-deoxy-D-manno-octulosonic-acid transferase